MTAGCLVLVATPIGNLGDTSNRAAEALRTADVIACEDTRHTKKLLSHLGITDVETIAAHEHNEQRAAELIADRVAGGQTVALVSDAGMPAISDPGELVVEEVMSRNLAVSVVPGPSAVVAAVAVSGIGSRRFCFEGFLPRHAGSRSAALEALATESRTMVFYEAPHRLAKTLHAMAEAFGPDRRVTLVRELTKMHEQITRSTLGELSAMEAVKGECVLVVEGASVVAETATDDVLCAALKAELETGASKRDAVATVTKAYAAGKRRVYDLALTLDVGSD